MMSHLVEGSVLVALLVCSTGAAAQDPSFVLKDGGIEFPDGTIQETAPSVIASSGALDLYVDAATGDDQNDGLSPAAAKLTIQAAVDAIPMVLGGDATVHIADGTYNEFVWIGKRARLGVYVVSIVGNESAPQNVVLDGQSVIEGAFLIEDLIVSLSGMSMTGFAEAIGAHEGVVRVYDCRFEQNTDAAIFAANSTLQLEDLVISNNPGDGISVRNSFLEDLSDCQITGNGGNGISLSASKLGGQQLQVSNNAGVGIESSESSHVNLYDVPTIVIQNNTGGDMSATYHSSIRGYENGTTGACQADASSVCEP